MSFGTNNNNNPAKADVFNKVKFSSVKLGQSKQGSPTLGLYLKKDQAERLVGLLTELLQSGQDGCKFSCIVISGKEYDSGYMYVNPKEQRQQGQQGQGQQQGTQQNSRGNENGQTQNSGFNRGGYQKSGGQFAGKDQARSFFESKRVDNDKPNS